MNRKNDMFSIFENVGDDIAERISNSCPSMSREEKERVFAMSERKLNDMKKTKKIVDEVNVGVKSRTVENNVGKVEISDNPRSRRIAVTVTAVAAAFAVIVGVAFAAKNVGDIDVDSDISSVSSDKDLYAQISTTHDNADSENSNTVTSRESSADSEKVSGEENSKKEEKSSREKTNSSEVTSSKSESVHAENAGSSAVQSAAAVSSQSVGVNEQQPDTVTSDNTDSTDSMESDISIYGTEQPTDFDDNEVKEILINLVSENFYCMKNIFVLSCLPTEDTGEPLNYDDESSLVRKVVSDRFPDYASLDEYVHSVYQESYADYLMTRDYYNGHVRYINKNGELYCDLYTDGGKGYYVDTENFDIEISKYETEDMIPVRIFCLFTVKTTAVIPGSDNETEHYEINASAVLENGSWRLSEMFS